MNKQHHFSETRKENLKEVLELVQKNGPVSQNKIIGLIDWYLGKTEKTALTYLRTLQATDLIKWNDKKKVWKIA